jgi:hypothetical protein
MVSQRSLDVKLMDRHVQSCDVCRASKITRGAVPKQREDDAAQRTLLERVWGSGWAGDTRLVDVHVQRLRAKIEVDPASPELVQTVRGVGYKLVRPSEDP